MGYPQLLLSMFVCFALMCLPSAAFWHVDSSFGGSNTKGNQEPSKTLDLIKEFNGIHNFSSFVAPIQAGMLCFACRGVFSRDRGDGSGPVRTKTEAKAGRHRNRPG